MDFVCACLWSKILYTEIYLVRGKQKGRSLCLTETQATPEWKKNSQAKKQRHKQTRSVLKGEHRFEEQATMDFLKIKTVK